MNRNNTDEYEFPDAVFDESISEADPDDMSLSGDDDLCKTRIDEFRDEALRRENPLCACLGSVLAGLLKIASKHEAALNNSLQSSGGNILESSQQRGINTHLNLTREVHRLANLDVKFDEAEQQAANTKARRMMAGVPGPGTARFR